jgi:uncharacterized membrane protein (UPF0127 family)
MMNLLKVYGHRWGLAITVVLLLSGCPNDRPWVEVKGERFHVAIAADDESRSRGLMFVDELPRDEGMLFIFRQMAPRAFWMKNTRIPLDIIYLDSNLKVVSIIKNAKPCKTPRCPSYPSQRPAQYVLELNAGMSDQLGLVVGDSIVVGALDHIN